MNDAKAKFLAYVTSKLMRPVLMGAKGYAKVDDVVIDGVHDCSGLVTCAIRAATGTDITITHKAQQLANATPLTDKPEKGDLVFYGSDWEHVSHVSVWMDADKVISASGATFKIKSLIDALRFRNKVALEPIRYHPGFLGIHKNTYIETKAEA